MSKENLPGHQPTLNILGFVALLRGRQRRRTPDDEMEILGEAIRNRLGIQCRLISAPALTYEGAQHAATGVHRDYERPATAALGDPKKIAQFNRSHLYSFRGDTRAFE
jgi:hypothetical protein